MCTDKRKKRRRLLSDLMEGQNMKEDESGDFYVKSSTSDFTDRQRNIFGGLATLEAKHNEFQEKSPKEESEATLKEEPEIVENDVTFKIPKTFAVRQKGRQLPAYVKQPGKWIKYSLADVDDNQMTDRSNMDAALSFLSQRRIERERMEETEENGNSAKASSHSGKWTMPEYVVGLRKNKCNKRKLSRVVDSNAVGLSHLAEAVAEDELHDVSEDVVAEEQKVTTKDETEGEESLLTRIKFSRKARTLRSHIDDDD